MNRLGGWQRLGIVATALWFVLVLGKLAFDVSSGETRKSPFYTLTPASGGYCGVKLPAVPNKSHYTVEELTCPEGAAVPVTPAQLDFSLFKLLAILVGPPVLLFSLVSVVVGTIKWVAIGFQRKG
jgi:hypothetical protein